MHLLKSKFLIITWLMIIASSCNSFSQELIPFSLNSLQGYVDKELNIIIEPEYTYVSRFYSNYAIVGLSTGEKRIIDNFGNNILTLDNTFQDLRYVTNNIFAYAKDEGYTLVQVDSDTIIAQNVGSIGGASNGIVALRYSNDSKMQYIDLDGNLLFPSKGFRKAFEFSESYATVITDDWTYGIINQDGEFVNEPNFRRLGQHFSEGLCPAQSIDRSTGYVRTDGSFAFKTPIAIKNNLSESGTDFEDGYALVQVSDSPNTWKIIDNQGKSLTDPIPIEWSAGFSGGIALISVKKNGTNYFGYILKNGDYLFEPIFDKAESFEDGYAEIILNGREGLIDQDGILYWSDEIVKRSKT